MPSLRVSSSERILTYELASSFRTDAESLHDVLSFSFYIAHPINSECRSRIQASVVEAYNEELERSQEPGYRPPDYDDEGDGGVDQGGGYAELVADLKKDAEVRHGDRSQRDDSGAPAGDKQPTAENLIRKALTELNS